MGALGLRLVGGRSGAALAGAVDEVTLRFTLAQFAAELADHRSAIKHLGQAVQQLRLVERCRMRDVWLQEALVRLGDQARLNAEYDYAHDALTEAHQIAEEAGLDRVRRAGVRNALGILAKDRGDHDGAARHYQDALQLLSTVYEGTAPELASVHHNLAGLAYARCEFDEAETHVRQALKSRRSHPVPEVAGLAGDLSVLGAVLVARREFDQAEQVLRRAMALWSEYHDEEHYEVAVCLHNLGALQQGRGDRSAARTSWEAALTVKERVLRDGHPEIAALRRRLIELDDGS